MGWPPSEQGGGERDMNVRRAIGARAGQCPVLLSPGTRLSTPEVIRAVHLRQQNREQGSVFKIERACMKHSSQVCVLGTAGCGVHAMQHLLQLEFCLQQLVNESL